MRKRSAPRQCCFQDYSWQFFISGMTRSNRYGKVGGAPHGINSKMVAKWHQRTNVQGAAMGPKQVRSTVLTPEQEAMIVAFRKLTLLPLDDCLYALQPSIPALTRSSLHRCLQQHGTSRLVNTGGKRPEKKRFKRYPIGYFHIDIAEVRSEEGRLYLFVAIDRTSKYARAAEYRFCTTVSPLAIRPRNRPQV